MDLKKLQLLREDTLSSPFVEKRKSDDFAGVYLHSNKPFVLNEHDAPIWAFYRYSAYFYPLYFLISEDAITDDFKELVQKYPTIKPITIPRLTNIYEFNNFSIHGLLHLIDPKHENLLYFQYDGWIIKPGFEELCLQYDWLGARWKEPIQVIENKFKFPPQLVGNGGSNFRRRSKCLEVLKLVERAGGQNEIVKGLRIDGLQRTIGPFLAEDAFFCHFGFGSGIFKPVSNEVADQFSREPITLEQYNENPKPSYNFHRID